MILYKILFSIKYDNLFYSELENLYFAESQEGKIMPNTYPPELQTAWAHVVAHAWKDPDFFTELTENPKDVLDKALESEKLRNNPDFLGHCLTIQSYGGAVFPLPPLPEELQNLTQEQLAAFADQEGFFGILRCT